MWYLLDTRFAVASLSRCINKYTRYSHTISLELLATVAISASNFGTEVISKAQPEIILSHHA